MRHKLAAALACLLLFSSCNYIPAGIESLLTAPQLNERQAEVDLALRSTVNMDGIQYKYPLGGDYRSPFVFYDLDGDGSEEAVIFFTYENDTANVRAKVLKQLQPGRWSSAYDIAGNGSEVEFIQFSHLKSQTGSCIIIGWQTPRRAEATLGVYSFENGVFETEVLEPYSKYMLLSDPESGLEHIALVAEDGGSGMFFISLLRKMGGSVAVADSMQLTRGVSEILQICRGLLWDGSEALYVDELRTDQLYATEAVRITPAGLFPAVDLDYFDDLYSATFREREVLSADINNDGIIEIPQLAQLAGYDTDELPLVEYMQMTEKGYKIVASAVVNQPAGYRVFFPERWADIVTVVRQPENNEWRFCRMDSETGQPSTELLRIQRYAVGDYRDRFTDNYILLEKKGAFEYKAYIPPVAGDALAVTQEEVKNMFQLL